MLLDSIQDALIDSLALLPLLFAVYIVIEIAEGYITRKNITSKSRWSPVIAAGLGLIPQCGFSIISADLYSKRRITIGALLAVFIATSDEAIPLLLSNPTPGQLISLLLILGIKFVLACAVGVVIDAIFVHRKQVKTISDFVSGAAGHPSRGKACDERATGNAHLHICPCGCGQEHICGEHEHTHRLQNINDMLKQHAALRAEHEMEHLVEGHSCTHEMHHAGCCGHNIEHCEGSQQDNPPFWRRYLLHPAYHTVKIFGFILAVNLIFSILIYAIGQDNLMSFLNGGYWLAPLIACLIGLIPNCAASVVITQIYILGGIPFGACLAGLIINAGLGFIMLFKENKNHKQNFAILGGLFIFSVIVGYAAIALQTGI